MADIKITTEVAGRVCELLLTAGENEQWRHRTGRSDENANSGHRDGVRQVTSVLVNVDDMVTEADHALIRNWRRAIVPPHHPRRYQ